jgi:hypothetical protein
MHNLIDLSEFLKPEAFKTLNKGQTLGFQQEDGSIQRYKIIRLNKTRRTGFAEKVTLYTEDEMKQILDDRNA